MKMDKLEAHQLHGEVLSGTSQEEKKNEPLNKSSLLGKKKGKHGGKNYSLVSQSAVPGAVAPPAAPMQSWER